MAYDNNNRGAFWKNDDKQTDKHPDLTGSMNVNGVEYWVNGWRRKEGDNPKAPALRFTLKEKDQKNVNPPADYAKKKEGNDFINDDIPF